MQTFSDQQDIFATIQQQILNPRGTLYHEPQLLLMEELREPRNYFAILRTIAEGRRRLNEIAQGAGINDARAASRFLDILRQLHVITREIRLIGIEAGWQLPFSLFAKSGFTPDLQQLAADQGVLLVTPDHLAQEL